MEFLGVGMQNILAAVAILIGSAIIGKAAYFIISRWGRRLAEKSKNKFDDVLIEIIEAPIFYLVLIIGLMFAFQALGVRDAALVGGFNVIIQTLVIGAIAWFGIKFVDALVEEIIKPLTARTKSDFDDQLIPLVSRSLKLGIVLIAGIIMLDGFGFDITALIAGLGVGGLALAFAAKETIANVFGGIQMIFDKTFKIGDKIELDNGVVGVVHDISLRSTRIRTYSNEVIIVPNAQMANSRIKNFAQPALKTRADVEFGVAYGSDTEKVKKVTLGAISGIGDVLKDPAPSVIFKDMGDFALGFKAMMWVDNYDKVYSTRLEAVDRIHKALNKAKIGIPFPTQTVHLKK